MGSSPFEAASFEVELDDGCGMSFSAVHKVRAEACLLLEEKMLAGYAQRAHELNTLPPFKTAALTAASMDAAPSPAPAAKICATVTNLAAAEAAREASSLFSTRYAAKPIITASTYGHKPAAPWPLATSPSFHSPTLSGPWQKFAAACRCITSPAFAPWKNMERAPFGSPPNLRLPRLSTSPRMQKPLAASLSWESHAL